MPLYKGHCLFGCGANHTVRLGVPRFYEVPGDSTLDVECAVEVGCHDLLLDCAALGKWKGGRANETHVGHERAVL